MFDWLRGWGPELATLLTIIVVPVLIAIIRIYLKERDRIRDLEHDLKEIKYEMTILEKSNYGLKSRVQSLEINDSGFEKFIVRYEALETEMQRKISELIVTANSWEKFQAEWKGYQKAKMEKSGSRPFPKNE